MLQQSRTLSCRRVEPESGLRSRTPECMVTAK